MTTPRTQPARELRVDKTAEEVPPADMMTSGTGRARGAAAQLVAPLSPQRYVDTMVALADANTTLVTGVLDAQAHFATRLTGAMMPRSR